MTPQEIVNQGVEESLKAQAFQTLELMKKQSENMTEKVTTN